MEKVPLKTVLAENLAILEDMFGDSADYYAKPIRISGVRAAIVLFDNLTALQALWNLLLESAARPQEITGMPWKARNGETLYQDLMELTDIPAEKTPAADFAAVTEKLTAGFALLLLDGCAKAVVFSVQNMKSSSTFRSFSPLRCRAGSCARPCIRRSCSPPSSSIRSVQRKAQRRCRFLRKCFW